MSQIAELLGHDADAEHYRNVSAVYIKKWEELGTSRDGSHAKLAYDWYGSWTTLYSLYADAVLCFHPGNSSSKSISSHAPGPDGQIPLLPPRAAHGDPRAPITSDFIPSRVYSRQSSWYAAVLQKYGLPLDSRHLYAKSDWQFEAAAVTAKKVRAEILTRVARWLNETSTDKPFTDLYDTEGTGGFPGPDFFARPVVGGHFAFLTLERACGGKAGAGLAFLEEEAGGYEVAPVPQEAKEEEEWTGAEREL